MNKATFHMNGRSITLGGSDGIPLRSVTEEEYDALTEEEKMAEIAYLVTDAGSSGESSEPSIASGVPSGVIVMWSGDSVPDGWALCNGDNGTPDLRGRFVLGSSDSYAIGDTGGEETVTLTVDQMPSHNHILSGTQPYYAVTSGSNSRLYTTGTLGSISGLVSSTGSGKPHNNMPPYYVLAYIMKL